MLRYLARVRIAVQRIRIYPNATSRNPADEVGTAPSPQSVMNGMIDDMMSIEWEIYAECSPDVCRTVSTSYTLCDKIYIIEALF